MPARRGFKRDEILAMYENGMTQKDIAEALGASTTTICYYINQAGLGPGKGNYSKHKNRGGVVASSIPKVEYVVTEEEKLEEEKRVQAEKNAANACLVVEDRIIKLEGVFGKYHVSTKEKFACIKVNDCLMKIGFNDLATFANEIRALARNVGALEESTEMW